MHNFGSCKHYTGIILLVMGTLLILPCIVSLAASNAQCTGYILLGMGTLLTLPGIISLALGTDI